MDERQKRLEDFVNRYSKGGKKDGQLTHETMMEEIADKPDYEQADIDRHFLTTPTPKPKK